MDTSNQTVELFCGAKGFSLIAQALGYDTFTLDKNPNCSPSLVADILLVSAADLPSSPLVVWAALPDTAFTDRKIWEKDGTSLTPAAADAMEVLSQTINLIREMRPKWWFIENPRSLLRGFPVMAGFNRGYPTRNRHTIDHSEYGPFKKVETDIWTNAFWWVPRPLTPPIEGEGLEVSRRVPPMVYAEILGQLDQYMKTGAVQIAGGHDPESGVPN
jgi:hypothetical protein